MEGASEARGFTNAGTDVCSEVAALSEGGRVDCCEVVMEAAEGLTRPGSEESWSSLEVSMARNTLGHGAAGVAFND